MADTLLTAEPGTLALEVQYDGDGGYTVIEHPVVGFAYVSGGMAHPLTAANCTNIRAVAFPDGRVTDRQSRMSYPSRAKWVEHTRVDRRDVAPDPLAVQQLVNAEPETREDSNEVGPESRPIGELDLSTRAKNALNNGLEAWTVADLSRYTEQQVKMLKGFPVNGIPVVRAALEAEGLSFSVEPQRGVPGYGPKANAEPEADPNDDLL